MSILSSSNTGLKSIKVNVNFLLERGYYFNGPKLVYGDEPNGYFKIYAKSSIGTKHEAPLYYTIMTLSEGKLKEFIKIEIKNFHDLLLLEHFWKSKRKEHNAVFQELKKLSIEQGLYKNY